ncbi:MAG: hypothetical protein VYD12_02400 [Pseudomonadota bacterium]|nr:hypothetical protein [Pseudomonadota bacterium]
MLFPNLGQFSLTVSNNILEVYVTGAWDLAMANLLVDEMLPISEEFNNVHWAAIIDCRRWVLSTPESQVKVREGIARNIEKGLRRAAYVVDTNHIKHVQLERTNPQLTDSSPTLQVYERQYFSSYLEALKWLQSEGYTP